MIIQKTFTNIGSSLDNGLRFRAEDYLGTFDVDGRVSTGGEMKVVILKSIPTFSKIFGFNELL